MVSLIRACFLLVGTGDGVAEEAAAEQTVHATSMGSGWRWPPKQLRDERQYQVKDNTPVIAHRNGVSPPRLFVAPTLKPAQKKECRFIGTPNYNHTTEVSQVKLRADCTYEEWRF